MLVYRHKYDDKWIEASVLGSLWGSFEIIIGSFLHNIRLPLSGTFLAAFSVVLMVAYSVQTGKSGIFWRASIIAALMKSISPSVILLGPMTAIILEGLLMEIGIIIFGRNLIAYIVSGILVLYSVVVHKLVALLVIYGTDLIKITRNFYFFIIKQLKINEVSFFEAIFLLTTVYIVLGMVSAFVGYFLGRNSKTIVNSPEVKLDLKKIIDSTCSMESKQFSVILFVFHFFMLFFLIWQINTNLFIGALLSFGYLFFSIYRYPRLLRRFKKFGIWFQLFIVFLMSVFFYNGIKFFDFEGISAGAAMILRSIVVIVSFMAISFEISSPFIKALLLRNGFGKLYRSLSLAFSAMPLITSNFRAKEFFSSPLRHVSELLAVNYLYDEFRKIVDSRRIIVITGEINSGKTTAVVELLNLLNNKGETYCGILSVAENKDGKKQNYWVEDLTTGKRERLCSTVDRLGRLKIGRCWFSDEGLSFGLNVLFKCQNTNFVIIDEIGPLELMGKGWSAAIENLFISDNLMQIWVVRKKILYQVLKRFDVSEAYIFDVPDNINNLFEFIENKLKKYKKIKLSNRQQNEFAGY